MSETPIDNDKRKFLLAVTSAFAGLGAIFASVPFISSWWPSAKAQAAGAPVEADISRLEAGEMMTVEWRGKPVWIIRRTEEMLKNLKKHDDKLRDANSVVDQQPDYATNVYRSIKPEILVLVGICTHLGCVPTYVPYANQLKKSWPGGFYCPCHGSTFDLAGRVFTGVPAPINLEIPPHRYINANSLLIGEDSKNV